METIKVSRKARLVVVRSIGATVVARGVTCCGRTCRPLVASQRQCRGGWRGERRTRRHAGLAGACGHRSCHLSCCRSCSRVRQQPVSVGQAWTAVVDVRLYIRCTCHAQNAAPVGIQLHGARRILLMERFFYIKLFRAGSFVPRA